jgi:hypothetical protein
MPGNVVLMLYLVALAIDVLNRDYEENALLASRNNLRLVQGISIPTGLCAAVFGLCSGAYRALPAAIQRNFTFPALSTCGTLRPIPAPVESIEEEGAPSPPKSSDGDALLVVAPASVEKRKTGGRKCQTQLSRHLRLRCRWIRRVRVHLFQAYQ